MLGEPLFLKATEGNVSASEENTRRQNSCGSSQPWGQLPSVPFWLKGKDYSERKETSKQLHRLRRRGDGWGRGCGNVSKDEKRRWWAADGCSTQKFQLSKDLSDLVTLCKSVRFKDFQTAFQNQKYWELCSFNEVFASRYATDHPGEFVNYNKKFSSEGLPKSNANWFQQHEPAGLLEMWLSNSSNELSNTWSHDGPQHRLV